MSNLIYDEAEQIILNELGFVSFKSRTSNISIKNLSKSFELTGRFDAEHYQQKYDDYKTIIESYPYGHTTVGGEFKQVKNTFTKSRNGYNYIEISDIDIAAGVANSNYIETQDLPANAKIKISYKNMLISKVRPNRGAVAIIDSKLNNLVASGAFTVLKEKSGMSIEVLFVLLRSYLYKDWLLKWNVGSSYPVIKDKDILNLPIPTLQTGIQSQITKKIQESFKLREESKSLLEKAKRAIEIAIEDGEVKAMEWINIS